MLNAILTVDPIYTESPSSRLYKIKLDVEIIFAVMKYEARLAAPPTFFVTVPRTSLAGLKSTVNVLPCTNNKTEVLDSFLSA